VEQAGRDVSEIASNVEESYEDQVRLETVDVNQAAGSEPPLETTEEGATEGDAEIKKGEEKEAEAGADKDTEMAPAADENVALGEPETVEGEGAVSEPEEGDAGTEQRQKGRRTSSRASASTHPKPRDWSISLNGETITADKKRKRKATPSQEERKRPKTEDAEQAATVAGPSEQPSAATGEVAEKNVATPFVSEKDRAANAKRFQRGILQIHSQISERSSASPFRDPVRPADAPNYTETIKKPMNLKTIGKRVRDGQITSSAEFRRDVLLMFANAVMFNSPDSEIARLAHEMVEASEEYVFHLFDFVFWPLADRRLLSLIHLYEAAELTAG
jgi:bromodomain-containing protein 8